MQHYIDRFIYFNPLNFIKMSTDKLLNERAIDNTCFRWHSEWTYIYYYGKRIFFAQVDVYIKSAEIMKSLIYSENLMTTYSLKNTFNIGFFFQTEVHK
jgi:hypothetical protein